MDKLKATGGKTLASQADVRNEDDVKNMLARTIDEYGRLDILINNAGVEHKKRLEETTLEEYNETMDTKLKGVFLCTKYAIPQL
jgi:3-oxoacyl-[acyl-carrier protein] reductase